MSQYSYDDLRSRMDTLIRALTPASSHKAVLAGAGIPTVSGSDYETVDFSTGDVSITPTLVGSAFAPAADSSAPEGGPDATLADSTMLAILLKAVVEAMNERDDEIKSKVNDLIDDYNTRFSTSFATLT